MSPAGSDNGPPIRWRIMLNAREIADHPELHQWANGPLAEAMAEAPWPLSLWIVHLDDDPPDKPG